MSWIDDAIAAIHTLADGDTPFTADEVTDLVGRPNPRGQINMLLTTAHLWGITERVGQIPRGKSAHKPLIIWRGSHHD
jgi:hypothetical protein